MVPLYGVVVTDELDVLTLLDTELELDDELLLDDVDTEELDEDEDEVLTLDELEDDELVETELVEELDELELELVVVSVMSVSLGLNAYSDIMLFQLPSRSPVPTACRCIPGGWGHTGVWLPSRPR
jgi:hypothetical protein